MGQDISAALVDGRRVFDLGQTLEMGMPDWPNQPPFVFSLYRRHGDVRRAGGFSFASEIVVTGGHTGTHLDALGHISCDGNLYTGLPADETQRGGQGLSALGIETVPPIVRRGVLLDAARVAGVEALPTGTALTGDDLREIAATHRVQIRPGDCVLVRTGWGRYWPDPSRYLTPKTGVPGPNGEACRWLAEQRVFLAGADTPSFEYVSPRDPHLVGHLVLIVERGVYILENMNLESLAAAGVHEFVFVCSPLKIVGGTGSPVRPIAIA